MRLTHRRKNNLVRGTTLNENGRDISDLISSCISSSSWSKETEKKMLHSKWFLLQEPSRLREVQLHCTLIWVHIQPLKCYVGKLSYRQWPTRNSYLNNATTMHSKIAYKNCTLPIYLILNQIQN